MAVILKAENIVKRFGELVANNHINFETEEGSIHCLLGENGAGKTTLMNILYGLYPMDEGKLYMDGREVKFHSPADAIKEGIGMVSQNFSLVPRLSVTENIILAKIPSTRFYMVDKKGARERVIRLAENCGLHIDPDAKVEEIATGEQQRVEIVKAVYKGAKILILDEPTAVLTSQEVSELFNMLRSMAAEGRAIIFITHKLDEALRCDQITVLRVGKVVLDTIAASTTKDELCQAMFGEAVCVQERKTPMFKESPIILEVNDLYAQSHRKLSELKGISFNICAGEIFGVAGIAGNGQTELAEAITGLRQVTKGKVLLKGVDITNCSPSTSRSFSLSHIPENSRKTGSFGDLPISANLISGKEHEEPFAKGQRLVFVAIKRFAKKMINMFDIKAPGPSTLAKHLSGGNLRKVVLARELGFSPDFIIGVNPTSGLDVKTTEFVHEKLLEERANGKAILLVSQDLSELLTLADRIGVMYEGYLKLVPLEQCVRERVERMMVGFE